jgi:hypothetical protein
MEFKLQLAQALAIRFPRRQIVGAQQAAVTTKPRRRRNPADPQFPRPAYRIYFFHATSIAWRHGQRLSNPEDQTSKSLYADFTCFGILC